MILSNVELYKALDAGRLIIDPEPAPRVGDSDQHSPFDTHSVDLTLHSEISIPEGGPFAWDLTQPGLAEEISKHCKHLTLSLEQPYRMEPGKFILAMTHERIGLPIQGDVCLAARVEGKSSRARCGILVHFTAPTVHPGWDGRLTLEMINLGPAVFMLTPGMAICQLIVEEVRGRPIESPSQFQGQSAPEGTG